MFSMTGYGIGVCENQGKKITVEAKSFNHRFLDISLKTPKSIQFADDLIRRILKDNLKRGHIDVYVSFEDKSISNINLSLNIDLAKKYLEMAKTLEKIGFLNNLNAKEVLSFKDVVNEGNEIVLNQDFILELIEKATLDAVNALMNMRLAEGERLKEDFFNKIFEFEDFVEKIIKRVPIVANEFKEKLVKRITEALVDVKVDEYRLLNEIAFYADKSSIDEEITRLKSHIEGFKNLLNNNEISIGKKLDFLIQETNREVNTIGSKSNDTELTSIVLELKSLIEMLREQAQNIE